jgi:hypothetical protein
LRPAAQAEAQGSGDVVLSRGKFEGMKMRDIPTWYLQYAVRNGYMLKTPEWMAAKDELKRRERRER